MPILDRLAASITFMLVLLSVSCSENPIVPPAVHPDFLSVTVDPNPHNVLSAIVTVGVEGSEQLAVEFGPDSLLGEITPFFQTGDSLSTLPLLGLRSEAITYLRALAISTTGHEARSDILSFESGAMPPDLPELSVLLRGDPDAGYVMMSFPNAGVDTTFYALIVDNDAQVVWYRGFEDPVVDFQRRDTGGYSLFASENEEPRRFLLLDVLGNVVGERQAGEGYETGPHEYRERDDGHALFAIEHREMDLSALGGLSDALVRGTHVEFHRPGEEVLRWDPFEHMLVSDAAGDIPLGGASVNPWHGNALDIGEAGDIYVSFRNSDTVLKIDPNSGDVLWRLGGERGQFTFLGDPLDGFSHQHCIRELPGGNLLLFDNGNLHQTQASRAVEYRVDEEAETAELVWEYRHDPSVYGFAMGSVQRLSSGHTLINYGTGQRIVEVDEHGQPCWELAITAEGVFPFRAFRIGSLF